MNSYNPSVLIAVSHGLYEPWLDILHDGQERTWLAHELPPSLQVIHFHGTPTNKLIQLFDRWHEKVRWSGIFRARTLRIVDRTLAFPWMRYVPKYGPSESLVVKGNSKVLHIYFPDTYVTYRWKELALFEYFLFHTDLDFLFVTSTASYVSYPELINYVSTLPKNGVYAGAHPYPEASFVSGACRIISRDVVKYVLTNKRNFDVGVIEDMALGDLIRGGGFKPVFIPPNNISSIEDLLRLDQHELSGKFHFRLKSFVGKKRNDVELMHALHLRLNGAG